MSARSHFLLASGRRTVGRKNKSVSPRKQPIQARSQATVDAILRATIRVLTKEGFDRTSTNKVARTAGVSVGSLYQYFPSKEALVMELVERHHRQMIGILFERLAEVEAVALPRAIRTVVEALVSAHDQDMVLHRIVVEELPRMGKWGELMRAIEARATPAVRAYLEARKGELRVTDLDAATFVLVTGVQALTDRVVFVEDGETQARLVSAACDMLTAYLVAGP